MPPDKPASRASRKKPSRDSSSRPSKASAKAQPLTIPPRHARQVSPSRCEKIPRKNKKRIREVKRIEHLKVLGPFLTSPDRPTLCSRVLCVQDFNCPSKNQMRALTPPSNSGNPLVHPTSGIWPRFRL